MNRHYLRIFLVIYNYSKIFSWHIIVATSCENAKFVHILAKIRHVSGITSDNDSRKTPDICKWRIRDCAKEHRTMAVPCNERQYVVLESLFLVPLTLC